MLDKYLSYMVNSLREILIMANNTQPTQPPHPFDDFDDLALIRGATLLHKMQHLFPDFEPVPNRDSAQAPSNQINQQGEDSQMHPEEERHQRKCAVCQHPDRVEIEDEFIHWGNARQLAKQYGLADPRSIHRHARAYGLVELRRENRRGVLDRILERGPQVVTVTGVIQAIKAYSCLTDDNRWVEPPRRMEYNITSNRTPNPAPEKSAAPEKAPEPLPEQKKDAAPADKKPAAKEPPAKDPDALIPEPEVIHHAGIPPGPLPAWDGRVESSWGNPRR